MVKLLVKKTSRGYFGCNNSNNFLKYGTQSWEILPLFLIFGSSNAVYLMNSDFLSQCRISWMKAGVHLILLKSFALEAAFLYFCYNVPFPSMAQEHVISIVMKKLFCIALAAAVCFSALQSCGRKTDPEALRTYEMLQGTWETVHIQGHESSSDLQTGEILFREDFDEDISSPSHPEYRKMRLDRNNIVTLLELGDPDGTTLPASYPYTFNGNQLGGMVFSGDFAYFMTVSDIDGNTMTLELDDKGEYDGCVVDFYELITFRKIADE